MNHSERDQLFARARRAASPTEDDRRRVRAAIGRRIAAGTLATLSVTATKAAASGVPVASAVGTGTLTLSVAKLVALVGVVAVSGVAGGVLLARTAGPSATTATTSVPTVPATPAQALSVVTRASYVAPPPVRAIPVEAPPAIPVEAPPAIPVEAPPAVGVVPPNVPAVPALAPSAPAIPMAAASAPAMPLSTPTSRTALPSVAVAAPASLSPPVADGAEAVADGVEQAGTPVTPPSPASGSADAAAETALVAEMQAALRDGDTHRALVLVDEHSRRFPRGVWAPEREGARTLALCTGAHRVDAARIGESFLSRYPRSPLAGRVRATCGLHGDHR